MPTINIDNLPSTKGIYGLSDKELKDWNKRLADSGLSNISNKRKDVLYRNQLFINEFGLEAFESTPYEQRNQMYKEFILNREFDKAYKDKVDEKTWNLISGFSSEGKAELLKMGFLNNDEINIVLSERLKTKQELEDWENEHPALASMAYGTPVTSRNILEQEFQKNLAAKQLNMLDIVQQHDLDRLRNKEDIKLTTDENKEIIRTQLENQEMSVEDVDSMFEELVLPQTKTVETKIGNYEVSTPGSLIYQAFNVKDSKKPRRDWLDLSLDDKIDYISTYNSILQQTGDQYLAFLNLEDLLSNKVAENQKGHWTGNTVNQIKNKFLAQSMQEVLFILELNALAQSSKYGIEVYNNFKQGKDKDGNPLPLWRNPNYWADVDMYNTLDIDELNAIKKNNGLSPYLNYRSPEDKFSFISAAQEATAMLGYGASEMAKQYLLGGAGKILSVAAGAKYAIKGTTVSGLKAMASPAAELLKTESTALARGINKAFNATGVLISPVGEAGIESNMMYQQALNDVEMERQTELSKMDELRISEIMQWDEFQDKMQRYKNELVDNLIKEIKQRLMNQLEDYLKDKNPEERNLLLELNKSLLDEQEIRNRIIEDKELMESLDLQAKDVMLKIIEHDFLPNDSEYQQKRNTYDAETKKKGENAAATTAIGTYGMFYGKNLIENVTFKKWLFGKDVRNMLEENKAIRNQVKHFKDGKLGTKSKGVLIAKALTEQIVRGGADEYFDSVVENFAEGLGLGAYHDYIKRRYSVDGAVKVADMQVDTMTEIMNGLLMVDASLSEALSGAISTLKDKEAWYEGFVGALAPFTMVSPHIVSGTLNNVQMKKAGYKLSVFEKLNNIITNPLIREGVAVAQLNDLARYYIDALQKTISLNKELIDKSGTLLLDALKMDEAFKSDDIINMNNKRFATIFDLIVNMYSVSLNVELNPLSDLSPINQLKNYFQSIIDEKLPEKEMNDLIDEFINTPENQNLNPQEAHKIATLRLKEQAKEFIDLSNSFETKLLKLNQDEESSKLSFDARVQKVQLDMLIEDYQKRYNQLIEELQLLQTNETADTETDTKYIHDLFARFGSFSEEFNNRLEKKSVNELNSLQAQFDTKKLAFDDSKDKTEKQIKTLELEIANLAELLIKLLSGNSTPKEMQELLKKIEEKTKEYGELKQKRAVSEVELLLLEYRINKVTLDIKDILNIKNTRFDSSVIYTADELLSTFDVKSLYDIFYTVNSGKFSKEQLKEIEKAIQKLKLTTFNALDKLQQASIIQTRINEINEARDRINAVPMALDVYATQRSISRYNNFLNARNESLIDKLTKEFIEDVQANTIDDNESKSVSAVTSSYIKQSKLGISMNERVFDKILELHPEWTPYIKNALELAKISSKTNTIIQTTIEDDEKKLMLINTFGSIVKNVETVDEFLNNVKQLLETLNPELKNDIQNIYNSLLADLGRIKPTLTPEEKKTNEQTIELTKKQAETLADLPPEILPKGEEKQGSNPQDVIPTENPLINLSDYSPYFIDDDKWKSDANDVYPLTGLPNIEIEHTENGDVYWNYGMVSNETPGIPIPLKSTIIADDEKQRILEDALSIDKDSIIAHRYPNAKVKSFNITNVLNVTETSDGQILAIIEIKQIFDDHRISPELKVLNNVKLKENPLKILKEGKKIKNITPILKPISTVENNDIEIEKLRKEGNIKDVPIDDSNNLLEDNKDLSNDETSTTDRLLGNVMSEYEYDSKDQRRKEPLDPNNKTLTNFYEWLDSREIKYQDTIDDELPLIFEKNPDIKIRFLIGRLDSKIANLILLVIYTPEIEKFHKNGGKTIEANGKKWLVIGTLGYTKNNNSQSDWNRINEYVHKNAELYFNENQEQLYFVDETINTVITDINPGDIVRSLKDDETPTETIEPDELNPNEPRVTSYRTLSELLVDSKRNPLDLSFSDLRFAIQSGNYENPEFRLVGRTDYLYYSPNDWLRTLGHVFLMVKSGNGKRIPAMIRPVFVLELKDGSKLKNIITKTFVELTNKNFETRLNAISKLAGLVVLNTLPEEEIHSKENIYSLVKGKYINIGSESDRIITVYNNETPIATYDLNNLNLSEFLQKMSSIFRVNISPSVLFDKATFDEYNEANAIVTDLAKLGVSNVTYNVANLDKDFKPIPVEKKRKPAKPFQPNEDTVVSDFSKPLYTEMYKDKTYRFDENSNKWYDEHYNLITDSKENETLLILLKFLKYLHRIPVAFQEGNRKYYIYTTPSGKLKVAYIENNEVFVYNEELSKQMIDRYNQMQQKLKQQQAILDEIDGIEEELKQELKEVKQQEETQDLNQPKPAITDEEIELLNLGNFPEQKPTNPTQESESNETKADNKSTQTKKIITTDMNDRQNKSLEDLRKGLELSTFANIYNDSNYRTQLRDLAKKKGWNWGKTMTEKIEFLKSKNIAVDNITNVQEYIEMLENCH